MALTFEATSTQLPPYGLYVGKLDDIEDMGIQEGQYGEQHQVRLVMTISEALDTEDEEAFDEWMERGDKVYGFANLTFGPRSKLRKWCQQVAGREIEDGEKFNVSEIIGKAVRVTIAENTVGNPTVSDVAGYRKATKKKRKPDPEPEIEDEDEEIDDF